MNFRESKELYSQISNCPVDTKLMTLHPNFRPAYCPVCLFKMLSILNFILIRRYACFIPQYHWRQMGVSKRDLLSQCAASDSTGSIPFSYNGLPSFIRFSSSVNVLFIAWKRHGLKHTLPSNICISRRAGDTYITTQIKPSYHSSRKQNNRHITHK